MKIDEIVERLTKSIISAMEDCVDFEKNADKPKADDERIIDENHKSIRAASNKEILRRQMELLAEYSRLPEGHEHITECSVAMVLVYRELVKFES